MNIYSCLSYLVESNDTKAKIRALKKTINLILSGERLPNLLMVIMRFVMPSQDHKIKKLLLLYWEIVPKTHQDGKLLHEMILVCDAYRKVSSLLILFMLTCIPTVSYAKWLQVSFSYAAIQ